jgi:hypothetical protein
VADSPKEQHRQKAVTAAVSGISAFIGYRLGGPLAAAAGVAGVPYGVELVRHAQAELARKGNVIGDAALEASQMNADEFYEALLTRPELAALMEKIARAAAESGYEAKIRALGTLLGGAAARNGRPFNETTYLIDVLADIDEPDVRVLEILTNQPPDSDIANRPGQSLSGGLAISSERSPDQPLTSAPNSWLPSHVDQQLSMTSGLGLAALSRLTRHGLAEELGTYGGGSRFVITDLGRALLEVMNPGAAR